MKKSFLSGPAAIVGAFAAAILPVSAQGLTWERWNGLPASSSVLTLQQEGIAKRGPDTSGITTGAVWSATAANYYGVRMRGSLTAPQDGNYTFFIAGDDSAELWLSPDGSRFNKKKIAFLHVASTANQWDKVPSQRSAPVSLVGGTSYYIEAQLQQSTGAAHLSIGWTYETPVTLTNINVGTPVTQTWQETNGTISLSVDGGSIYGTSDRFGFHQRSWTGDCEVIARVTSMHSPDMNSLNAGAKVGVMMRTSTATGSAHAFMARTGADNVAFQRRLTSGATTANAYADPACEWVKLVRKGQVITGWFSADGIYWTNAGSTTFTGLPATLLVGLAATDGSSTVTLPVVATVENFGIQPLAATEVIPGTWLSTEISDPPDLEDTNGNGNGLPDFWEDEMGIATGTPDETGEFGDFDHDGIPNLLEYQLHTDPNSAPAAKNSLANGLTRERWENLSGGLVTSLTGNRSRFLFHPDEITHVAGICESGHGTNYASRYRGFLTAPATGAYQFWISGDDQAELWFADGSVRLPKYYFDPISPSNPVLPLTNRYGKQLIASIQDPRFGETYSAYMDFDKLASQHSRTVQLVAGQKYYIEVLHKSGSGTDHLALAWQRPGGTRELVPATVLSGDIPPDDDLEDSNLPAEWKDHFTLSLTDNGLANANNGQYGDSDADNLTNLTEYQLGTSPVSADTDGDGLTDKLERDYYHTDPTVTNILAYGPLVTPPTQVFTASTGSWICDSTGSLTAVDRRGEISYPFSVGNDPVNTSELKSGIIEITLTGSAAGIPRASEKLPLVFSVDGSRFASVTLTSLSGAPASVSVLTPWLSVGSHTLTILHDNYRADLQLRINSLSLRNIGGLDASNNQCPDWIDQRIAAENHLTRIPASSLTSPVCIEGIAAQGVNVQGVTGPVPGLALSANGNPVTPFASIDSSFYANVHLSESGATTLTASFQSGALTEGPLDITWEVTNLCQNDTLDIRQGDSLRLDAPDESGTGGTFTVRIGDPTTGDLLADSLGATTHTSGQPFKVTFDTPGTHILTATFEDNSQHTTTLRVHAASFGPDLSVRAYYPRTWTPPTLGTTLLVQPDSRLSWQETTVTGTPRSFRVTPFEAGERHVLARLPDNVIGAPGAIAADGIVNAFYLANVDETSDAQLIHTYPDGTRLMRATIVAVGLPADIAICLTSVYQGTTFPDGSLTLWLTAADFDQNGIANVFFEWNGTGSSKLCTHTDIFTMTPPAQP